MNGIGISWAICKSAPCSRQMTTPAPHHSVFYRPDALTATQSTAPKALRAAIVATLPWEVQKSHFLQYYSYILLIIYVISDERNCNPLAHSTWKCHYTNLWNAKRFRLTEGLLHSFNCWWLLGWHWWLWKELVVMCGNWNVWQTASQQVFKVKYADIAVCSVHCHTAVVIHMPYGITQCYLPPGRGDIPPAEACTQFSGPWAMQGWADLVTTICMDTCFQSFSPLINHIVHHAALKSEPMSQQAAATTHP